MNYQQTSLLAYKEIKDALGDRQQTVYDCLYSSFYPLCNQDIAKQLVWPINTITPRVKELRDMGLVKEAKRDVGPSGRTVIYWEVA